MFSPVFYESIKSYNLSINKINCSLRELEKDIAVHVENDPGLSLFSYEPLSDNSNHYFKFDYPNIVFSIPPFKATLSYREIMDALGEKTDNKLFIEQTIEHLIINTIHHI